MKNIVKMWLLEGLAIQEKNQSRNLILVWTAISKKSQKAA